MAVASPDPAVREAPPAAAPVFQKTVLGMPARDLPGLPSAPAPTPAPTPPAPFASGGSAKTMLGVAIPGIAPLHELAAPPPTAPTYDAAPVPEVMQSKHRTMLGVASPDLLPPHLRPPAPFPGEHGPSILPAPAPLTFAPLPEPPQVPSKRGLSALAVVGIVFAVVAVVGAVGAYFVVRSPGPLQVVHKLDEGGRETLQVFCPSCPDGTAVALGPQSEKIVGGTTVLRLPAPLSVGDNELRLTIDRPSSGRDEEVRVHVPVAYRVSLDPTTLAARPAAFTVRVEAAPGSRATVDGKDVPLDASGRGQLPIELGAVAEGPRDASVPFERTLPFSIVTADGKTETGKVTARTLVVPLHVDAPGSLLLTDKSTAAVAGQTQKNATITIDGQSTPVDAEGRFGVRVALSAMGEKILDIVASAPSSAPRTARARIVRVASLEAARKELDAASPLGFDDVASDPNAKIGANVVVEGTVVDARVSGGYSILLVDDRHACKARKAAPKSADPVCLVRVLHGDEDRVARGASVRAYGTVAGSVSANGSVVPDIAASLVVPVKGASTR